MKKSTYTIILLFITAISLKAQRPNTYPYPDFGKLGIGTTQVDAYQLTVESSLFDQMIFMNEEPMGIAPAAIPFRIIGIEDPELESISYSLAEAFHQKGGPNTKVFTLATTGAIALGASSNLSFDFNNYSLVADDALYTDDKVIAMNRIGIGTTSPTVELDVFGKIAMNNYKILLGSGTSNPQSYIQYTNGAAGINGVIISGAEGGLLASSFSDNHLFWKYYSAPGNGQNNNRIGINTNNPEREFHLNGAALLRNMEHESFMSIPDNYQISTNHGTLLEIANGDLIIGGGPSNNKFVFHMQYWNASADELLLAPINNGSYEWSKSMVLKTNGTLYKRASDVNDVTFASGVQLGGNWVSNFSVLGDGKLSATQLKSSSGINDNAIVVENTATNLIDFAVKGDGRVFAREVEVTLAAFPDYVFEKDYNLMSLSDLKVYIDENKHLPGIKSAETIEEEGIGLGELSRLQMEKIEELTLYIIELEDRIKKLETKE